MFNNDSILFKKYIADSHDIDQPVWDDYDESCNQKKYFGRENKYRFPVADVFAVICNGQP